MNMPIVPALRAGAPARRLAAVVLVIAVSGCAAVPQAQPGRTAEFTPSPSSDTVLGSVAFSAVSGGESGFILLDRGWDSLACRCALADRAERTLNVQYFAWYADQPSRLLADHLLQAAERGVRVRLLLDDLSLKVGTRELALLDAHSNVEVRTYNPAAGDYENKLRRNAQAVREFALMQRRMHNKLFLADGSMGLVGGRNVGDKYFDLSARHNYRDRDVLAVGPVATNLAATFDAYWNSAWAVELSRTITYRPGAGAVARHLAELGPRLARATADLRLGPDVSAQSSRLTNAWAEAHRGAAEIICDEPGKNPSAGSFAAFGATGARLTELALGVRRELIIQTPYAVLMPGTFDLLRELNRRGVKVRLVTNSKLSSLNPFAVTAYAEQRKAILKEKVELFEIRPDGQVFAGLVAPHGPGGRAVPVSLHAKAGIFDDDHVYIGSFNLDPRSTHLNTELGLFINSPSLNRELRRIMDEECQPQNSWQVVVGEDGELAWIGLEEGRVTRRSKEPGVSFLKGIVLFLVHLLPVDPLL